MEMNVRGDDVHAKPKTESLDDVKTEIPATRQGFFFLKMGGPLKIPVSDQEWSPCVVQLPKLSVN